MASKDEAKAAVLRIAKDYGHLNEEKMEKLKRSDPEAYRECKETIYCIVRKLSSAITTLAREIYTSQARFVFELLQNADDNSYSRANASQQLPSVLFEVYRDRIIVECNEDGFNEDHLNAICTVGESTKSRSSAYIGAKGIGFKSVFAAAWHVYIQSGHYSFSFKHQKGDTGLGMVVPLWENSTEELQGPLTRMTLHLHTIGDADYLRHLRQIIRDQFAELQETNLLFLRKIRQIKVRIYDNVDDGKLVSQKTFHADDHGTSRRILRVVETASDGSVTDTTSHFHVTTHTATGLAKSENRKAAQDEATRAALETAEVILAFPLSASSVPLINNQAIYAFLPVQESNFKFLVQSDFDTGANRQEISTSSMRNIQLRDEVAHAFLKAVLEFCNEEHLCYTWPLYLPQSTDNLGTFWSALIAKLQGLLKSTPILHSRHKEELRRMKDVFSLAGDFRDADGQPLLDNTSRDPFISTGYSLDVIKRLRAYGLPHQHFDLSLELLQADLEQPSPQTHRDASHDEWHTAFSRAFTKIGTDNCHHLTTLKRLLLVPLRGGTWVSVDLGSIYFPETNQISIPSGISLRVVSLAASKNAARKEFLTLLGVSEASRTLVRASIFEEYHNRPGHLFELPSMTLAKSKEHLHYLFLTHGIESQNENPASLTVCTEHNESTTLAPHFNNVYLPSDHWLGPQALLKASGNRPGLPFQQLHSLYLETPPMCTTQGHPSWTEWLTDFLHVRARLSLLSRDKQRFSDEWDYLQSHPTKHLLHLLEYLWKFEGSQISKDLCRKISHIKSEELFSPDFPFCVGLKSGWLPLSSLKERVKEFMGPNAQFPFLDLGDVESDEDLIYKWSFLSTHFNVGKQNNLSLLLAIHYRLKAYYIRQPSSFDLGNILNLYLAIAGTCIANFSVSNTAKIRDRLSTHGIAILPFEGEKVGKWIKPSDCLWDGPRYFSSKTVLANHYLPHLDTGKMNLLSQFFQDTLRILPASYQDLIEELDYLRDNDTNSLSHDRLVCLYSYFHGMNLSPTDQQAVESEFATRKLIYCESVNSSGWYTSTDCIWSTSTDIQGKVTLNNHYEYLEEFFISKIGVKELTLQMVYDQLVSPEFRATVDEIKTMILSFNSMMQTEGGFYQDPADILKARIFPVKYPGGSTELVSADTEFLVNDRDSLMKLFDKSVKLLDFGLEEVHRLRPFLAWTGLDSHYISVSIREITNVSDRDSRPISTQLRNLRNKAHGLLRIAATFGSPRWQKDGAALYALLRTIQVLENDNISATLRVYQDGQMFEEPRDVGSFHIDDTEDNLKIYVPANRRAQDICFGSLLPEGLAAWLMRDSKTQISDTVDNRAAPALLILFSVSSSVLDDILESKGIIKVAIPNQDERDEYDSDDREPDQPTSTASDIPAAPSTAPNSEMELDSVAPDYSSQGRGTPFVGPARPSLDEGLHDSDYARLLDHVVSAARQASFPPHGAFDMSGLQAALIGLSDHASFDGAEFASMIGGFRDANKLERDIKVGAAGELYVFELLSSLSPALTGWSRNNWKSTIRHLVALHRDYTNLQRLSIRETADLTYKDEQGDLTKHLIECGYLSASEWADARPEYFLEVKTTTGPVHTPFYMSKNQFSLMQRVHQTQNRSQIYLVLRVFHVDSRGISMKVYLDPEQLRQDQALKFTGEHWSVVPRS